MRDSVVFYRSFYEAVKELPPEEFKKSVSAIMEYGLNDLEPETSGIERTIYLLSKPQIDANNKRYQNGTKGGRPITEQKPNNNQTETKPKPNHNQTETKAEPKEKVNVNVKDKDKVKDKESVCTRFVPPTHQDVSDYCQEKGYTNVDIERFIDFYESKGWMVGKNKMKDWRAAVRNWSRSQRQELTTKGNKFNNFNQRQYDYAALEQQLLGGGAAHGK